MSKRRMQAYDFRGIEDFLSFLPETEYEITCILRELVFTAIPDVQEKLSYNVPFYRRTRNICFIWPGSVFWGSSRTYQGVRFGFSNGHLLDDEEGFLQKESRKRVYWHDFNTLDKKGYENLKSFLYQALEIDMGYDKKIHKS